MRQSVKQPAENSANSIEDIEDYLRNLLAKKLAQASYIDECYEDLLKQIGRLVERGGKRLRPKLIIESYRAYGGTNYEAIVKVAASQELFHAFILMHDDIIDRDLVRWGGPNISGHYLNELKSKLNPSQARHYADAWALLAGDMCFNLSYETLASSGFTPSRTLRALKLVQETLFVMVGGELIDVALPLNTRIDDDINEDQFIKLCDYKTSSYTFCTPLRLGALLAGAGAAQDKQLLAFGKHIGVAFQLRDDILDIFGDESKIGKSNLSDIHEGKHTLLINNGFKMANKPQLNQLKAIVGNPNATQQDLAEVRAILTSSGALKHTELTLHEHCQIANRTLLSARFPLQLSAHLADLLSFCATRTA